MALTTAQRDVLRSTALATALAAVVLLTRLGHNRLTDWDEGIYAGISRSMLSGDWLTPLWNGQPWLEKPPLMLWITALFFRLFGISEFTARLGSALSGVALVGLLHAWLTLRRNALTAWLSTIMLLSTFGFLHVARVGEMDVLLSLGCTMALIGLCELDRNNPTAWLLFWAGFTIALMTKGAASITLPITVLLTLTTNRLSFTTPATSKLRFTTPATNKPGAPHLAFEMWARNSARAFTLGLLLFLAIVLPWHLTMLHRFGHLFLDQYLGLHVLTRATSQIEGHLTPWWFYLRVLLVSAAPWVLLYPFALWHTLTNPGWPIQRAALGAMSGEPQKPAQPQTNLRPFAIFALVVLVLFSIAQTRLPHYIAPIYPALSVITAVWLETCLRPRLLASPNPRTFARKSAAAALAAFGIAALLTAAPRRSLHSPRLPNGDTTPDNREEIALLKQALQPPSAKTPETDRQLLFLRAGTYNPTPALVFYSRRIVQQVVLNDLPLDTHRDRYTNDPIPLTRQLHDREPHLLLADRALAAQLPPELIFQPIASGPTMVLGRVRLR